MNPTSLWIVWTLIGIIGGFMAGRLIPRSNSTVLAVCVGICGALLGGWLTIVTFGTNDKIEAISLLAAAILCGIFLWVMTRMSPRRNNDE